MTHDELYENTGNAGARPVPLGWTMLRRLALWGLPIGRQTVVIEHAFAARRAIPVPRVVFAELRRALELLLADIDLVAAELRIVGQQRPRQRIVVGADAHEAAEA